MIYSYNDYFTEGSQGTFLTYKYKPSDPDGNNGDKSLYLGSVMGKHYRYIPEGFTPVEQPKEINWQKADITEPGVTHYLKTNLQFPYDLPILLELTPDVEEVRHEYKKSLKEEFQKLEDNTNPSIYFTSSLGFKVNGDRRSGTNLSNILLTQSLNDKYKVSYKDYDNNFIEIDLEKTKKLLDEYAVNFQGLYDQKFKLSKLIDDCKTLEDFKKIDIYFTMQDFNKSPLKTVIKTFNSPSSNPNKVGLLKNI